MHMWCGMCVIADTEIQKYYSIQLFLFLLISPELQ